MAREYDTSVSRRQWQIGLFACALTVIVGAALAVAMLLGMVNPPRAANLVFSATNADTFIHAWDEDNERVFVLPNMTLSLPLTVEMEARNPGPHASAWGMALVGEGGKGVIHPIRIDNLGYVISLVGSFQERQQFLHLTRDFNRITAHIDASGTTTVRINDERFSQQSFASDSRLTVFLYLYQEPQLTWKAIKIYTG